MMRMIMGDVGARFIAPRGGESLPHVPIHLFICIIAPLHPSIFLMLNGLCSHFVVVFPALTHIFLS